MGRRPWQRVQHLVLLGSFAPAIALAQASDRTRPPVLVVEDLLGDDWKAARQAREEMARIGARGLPPLLAARAAAPASAAVRDPIDDTLRAVLKVLAEEVGRPLLEPAERVSADGALGGILGASDRERPDEAIIELDPADFGELGSIAAETPQDWFGKRQVARRSRSALVTIGPAATGFLFEVPPLLQPVHARALGSVLEAIYLRERKRALGAKDAASKGVFRESYRGIADLAVPIVSAGLRDQDPQVRAAFQQIRDDVLTAALDGLDSADPQVRQAAEDTLFRLGQIAAQPLERLAAGKHPTRTSAQSRAAAERIARRIRYGVSRELLRRIGHDFEDYAALPYPERRQRVFELERLGGEHAIPALRALLKEEPSDSVRTVAAIGLFRLGDPAGSQWLALNSAGISLPQISKRELAAIHMDQGLRYLTLGRFERAEHEFKSVIVSEPNNDTAWYNLACTYSRWGKVDEAIEHLKKAVEFGFDDTSHMKEDPDLDNIRHDARYLAIVEAIEEGGEKKDDVPEDDIPEDDIPEDDLEDEPEELPEDGE